MNGIKSQPLVCSGHTRPVPHLSFNTADNEGRYLLVSSCKDSKPMLRDGMTGDWLGTFSGHKGAVWCAMLSQDGTKSVTGSADFSARVWDTYSGDQLVTLPHEHIVKSVDISASGSHVVTGGHEKKLRLYDLQRPEAPTLLSQSGSATTAHDSNIKTVLYNEPKQQVISADDKSFKVWDLKSGQVVHAETFEAPLTALARAHDASLISLAYGKQVRFIDPDTLSPVLEHALPYTTSSASLQPISRDRFVTGSTSDGWVRVHSAETGEELEVQRGHHGPVHCVSYSPDGELYASGSEDGTIRLWLADTSKSYGLWRVN